jgi:hypothetical protein
MRELLLGGQQSLLYSHSPQENCKLKNFLSFFLLGCLTKKKIVRAKAQGVISRLKKAEIYDSDVPDVHKQDKRFLQTLYLTRYMIDQYLLWYLCSVILRYYLAKYIITAAPPTNRACN